MHLLVSPSWRPCLVLFFDDVHETNSANRVLFGRFAKRKSKAMRTLTTFIDLKMSSTFESRKGK